MFQFLMNHSIFIISAITVFVVARSEYKRYLREHSVTPQEFRSLLRPKLAEVRKELLTKLLVSLLVTVLISLISFREIWYHDAFHVVFLTNLMSKHVYKYLKRLV